MKFTITLTDAEAKAMSIISADPKEWTINAVRERARLAMEEIFQNEVQRMIADPTITEIPADREAVVMAYEPVVVEVLPLTVEAPVETVVEVLPPTVEASVEIVPDAVPADTPVTPVADAPVDPTV